VISWAHAIELADPTPYLSGGELVMTTGLKMGPTSDEQYEYVARLSAVGVVALAFSSGSAATLAMFQSLTPGDHVIAPEDAYYGTPALLRTVMANWGLTHTLVHMEDLAAVERAITPATRLIWTETPSNPLLTITDLRAIVALAKKAGAMVACDNTCATPLFQQPLKLGVDVAMHSVTKYISGHSDVLSGALIFREANAFFERVRNFQHDGGGVPSPFECWLSLRGMQTFPYRVRAHAANAQKVAEFLATQPRIEAVHYPGLKSHPGHKTAAAQMSGFGGVMSIQMKGGQAEAFKLISGVKLFSHATSLGSTHSLIEHRASVEGTASHTPANLLRLSIGLEHPDDLIEDLGQALGLL
jgi:cystathionine gamma-synthase